MFEICIVKHKMWTDCHKKNVASTKHKYVRHVASKGLGMCVQQSQKRWERKDRSANRRGTKARTYAFQELLETKLNINPNVSTAERAMLLQARIENLTQSLSKLNMIVGKEIAELQAELELCETTKNVRPLHHQNKPRTC